MLISQQVRSAVGCDRLTVLADHGYFSGKHLPFRSSTVENDMLLQVYWRDDCTTCAIEAQCTTEGAPG